jgi:hypothetical protein|nr:MAG TPA: hypothetical protein [Caudoviricetes sp.]
MSENNKSSAPTKAKVTAKKAVSTAIEEKSKLFCYCGPTIKNKVCKGLVFKGEVPEPFKTFFDEHPVVKSLLVEAEELHNAMNSIKRREGSYYATYKKIKEGDY